MYHLSVPARCINHLQRAGIFCAGLLHFATTAISAPQTISGFGTEIVSVLSELYTASIGVVTILAAVLLIFAFVTRMTANQQKATQATSWITRIIVAYIAINSIGLLLTVISGTLTEYNYVVP